MKIKQEDMYTGDMAKQYLEKQPLPIGRKEFEEWSDRIINAAVVQATPQSLKFSLAAMLMHLAPTEAFKEDAYFILSLRKAAINQTAHAMMEEIKENQKKTAEATAPTLEAVDGPGILEK